MFKFYIKRTFRIFSCYIAVLLVALLIGYIPNIASFVKHIFLMEGIGHFWTIPVEFIFYLIVSIFAIVICIVILSIQNSKYVIKFLNNSKFLIFSGNISFPLYLVHFVLLDKIKTESLILNSILVVVISFILAILINKFIEETMIKVSKVINKKLFEREEK